MFDTVIFDMDGTLCDVTERRQKHLSDESNKNWAGWNDDIGSDPPNISICNLARLFHRSQVRVVICTGRHEKYRRVTESWLLHHEVPYSQMYMRSDDDYRKDYVVKMELLSRIKDDGYKPELVIDDRDSVVAMWREAGLVCLQCAPGDF